MADYDLAIIGAGLNGACIARDAAGRGLRVVLIEQDDLGSGQSACMGLIQGHFTELERGALRGMRTALAERLTWLRTAPHLVRPLRVAMPAHDDQRPPWLIRAMLYAYDRLAPRDGLPASTTLDVTHHEVGVPLQRPFGLAFGWSECLADTSRIIALAAVDAAARGARIMTGARCVRADRTDVWRLAVVDRGQRITMTARGLVNATGAFIPLVAETVLRIKPPPVKLVVTSQIVVRRRFDHDGIYALQTGERRLTYLAPWHGDFTIIGTAARPFVGDPAIVSASAEDVGALCQAANRYFRERVEAADVIHAYAGVHAVDARSGRNKRSGTVQFDRRRGQAPLVTAFGGDVTMARRRAEIAVSRFTPFYPMSRPWTAAQPLPGGDIVWSAFGEQTELVRERWPFLDMEQAERLVRAYGTRLDRVLGGARNREDLGPWFGSDLSAAEVRYLMTEEWARFPDDILWRRSKLGLSMPKEARDALTRFMAEEADLSSSPPRHVEPQAVRR